MKQIIISRGKGIVKTVSCPELISGQVLVRNAFSFMSVGTETSSLVNTAKPLWKRALENPPELIKLRDTISNIGFKNTKELVSGRLLDGNEIGYSSAGEIVAVSENIKSFKIGDYVACAGAGFAMHAEYVTVPENLITKKPDNVSFQQASTVALGSISLNGVRRAEPKQGEVFLVIGLGILGYLSTQILVNNGCRIIGIDLEPSKVLLANELKNVEAYTTQQNYYQAIKQATDGHGVDGVIVTASSKSDDIIKDAFKCCRKKGRVVLVGDVGLNINRADIYKKEIDFLIACSYGPGRYDNEYEIKGNDYPYAFVRWTENRNMKYYLDLIENNKINVKALTSDIFEIDDVEKAYSSTRGPKAPFAIIFNYNTSGKTDPISENYIGNISYKCNHDKLNISVLGAGSFARAMHLPNIDKLKTIYNVHSIVNRSGNKAKSVAYQYNAKYSTTEYKRVLEDNDVDIVIISTRHNLHGKITYEALLSGKNVMVEKPLCIKPKELEKIKTLSADSKIPYLLVGYNRRFSPLIQRVNKILSNRRDPILINYIVNANYLPRDNWNNDTEGGGRNIGEACHMYDIFNYLTNSKVKNISARSVNLKSNYYSWQDNFTANIAFEDGSICNLIYSTMGSQKYPKETITIFSDGRILKLDNYKKLSVHSEKSNKEYVASSKGHLEELKVFAEAINKGNEQPIPMWQLVQASEISFEVERQIQIA